MSLTITIQSFSYKKGIPTDDSGNGGGFVFDCRGILNPGRIEHCKTQSGLDSDVILFLEEKTEMPSFLRNVYSLVDLTVRNYLERDFKHLQINFGCTGGQHRSVYAATQLTTYLHNRYPKVVIHLEHTNAQNWVR
ncbi:MAG: ATP-binding protein [Flavobacteriaceae bacterium]|nr:ATP-binding protein [Flavobacteriaceae bacterium]